MVYFRRPCYLSDRLDVFSKTFADIHIKCLKILQIFVHLLRSVVDEDCILLDLESVDGKKGIFALVLIVYAHGDYNMMVASSNNIRYS